MKKLLIVAAGSLVCLTAIAQGKIGFATDSLHLVYYRPGAGYGLDGTAVSSGNMPGGGGLALVADLYMGTSSSSLYLYSSTTFSSTPGMWNLLNVMANANPTTGAPAIPSGTSVFVLTQIRNSAYAPENVWTPGFYPYSYFDDWTGYSEEFAFTLGGGVSFPRMYSSPN